MRAVLLPSTRSNGTRPRLRTHWFDGWRGALDDALALLPENGACSHELFRILAANGSRARKRLALVTEADTPIAVVSLRRRNYHWDLVTEGVVPSAFPPCVPGREIDALAALGLFVWVNEWERPVPESRFVRFVQYEQIFRVSTRVDFDAFWHQHGNTKAIKKARKRCERLGRVELEVDDPEAAMWTIDRWERAWAGDPWAETVAASDIRAAVAYLAQHQQHHALRLLIGGRPVAGLNAIARGDALVMGNTGRDPEFDGAGTGVHLDELFYRWAACSPYQRVDLGGGFDYKARWSDPDGIRARFSIAPTHLAVARHGLVVARWFRERMSPRSKTAADMRVVVPTIVAGAAEATRWV
jgi:hypothetical protein